MNFDEAPEFTKDLKALKKRVPTLKADLARMKKRIESLYIVGDNMTKNDLQEFRTQFFSGEIATILPGSTEEIEVVKIRLDSDSEQYRGKLRLVFAAVKRGKNVLFVELYSKSDKNREDSVRIKKYI